MKKIIISIILFTTVINMSYAQETKEEFKPSGQAHFTVFWNYHADLTKDATKTSAFELNRSYLGYKYAFSDKISAKITFDVGSGLFIGVIEGVLVHGNFPFNPDWP